MHARLARLALGSITLGSLATLGCAPPEGAIESAQGEVVVCGHGPTVEGINVNS
jgi:hypothetical protein